MQSVKIGGFNVAIVVTEPGKHLDESRFGTYNPREMKISIDGACCQQRRQEVLLHEILEVIADQTHTSLAEPGIDHDTLSRIATALYQVFRDNNMAAIMKQV